MTAEVSRHLDQTCFGDEHPRPSYRGKVRDVFDRGEELIIVASDRISVFDQVIGTIPLKGALLTTQSSFWLQKATSVIQTHFLAQEDPQIQRCRKAEPFRFEMIVRGYLTGSLLREPTQSRGAGYGLTLDPQMRAFEAFESPILTPSTKADFGHHDEPLSLKDIITRDLATLAQLEIIRDSALRLFQMGSLFAKERGLILVDTKYEFGLCEGKVILIDEIHTADSSRYWIDSSYTQRLAAGLEPEMLDKERLRRVLIAQGADPKGHGPLPTLTDDMRSDLSLHYWKLTETLLGENFIPANEPAATRVANWLKAL
jgi:phosphoribosylaminoimidazole-succinocarboxamide synthase